MGTEDIDGAKERMLNYYERLYKAKALNEFRKWDTEVLYQLLEIARPFEHSKVSQLIRKVLRERMEHNERRY